MRTPRTLFILLLILSIVPLLVGCQEKDYTGYWVSNAVLLPDGKTEVDLYDAVPVNLLCHFQLSADGKVEAVADFALLSGEWKKAKNGVELKLDDITESGIFLPTFMEFKDGRLSYTDKAGARIFLTPQTGKLDVDKVLIELEEELGMQ